MKHYLLRVVSALLILLLLCAGCARSAENPATVIAATTRPVAQFADAVCEGTGIEIRQVVTGQISCLHDYTLTVRQMEAISAADLILMSGCGLEEFMDDAVAGRDNIVTCADGIALLESDEGADPHIWLDPDNAAVMVRNIAASLSLRYPEYGQRFSENAEAYCVRLAGLKEYGRKELSGLRCRQLITFHDGFSYFADAFDLEILAALEEEDGAMASAKTLEEIIELVRGHHIPAIFIETNGSDSAASVIAAETGISVFTLSMAMSGDDYFTAMKHNFDTIKEALE